jgi:5'-methylthioadenosine phosphorylase
MAGLENLHEERVTTPFGEPSDAFLLGRIGGREIAWRHGRGHRLLPTEIVPGEPYGFKTW